MIMLGRARQASSGGRKSEASEKEVCRDAWMPDFSFIERKELPFVEAVHLARIELATFSVLS